MANNPVAARDTSPTQGVVALVSAAAAIQAGRAVLFNCTGTGSVTFTFPDGSSVAITAQINTLYEFNWSVTGFTLGTATGSAWNEL